MTEYYQIYSNDDLGLTLTYFTARSNLVPYGFEWKMLKLCIFLLYYHLWYGNAVSFSPFECLSQGHLLTLAKGHLGWRFLKSFILETTWQIEIIFNLKSMWDDRNKFYSNTPGHLTKKATMPKYGKNIKISSPPEPQGQLPWNLECSIKWLSATKFVQILTLGWPWPILCQCQIWFLRLLNGKCCYHHHLWKYSQLQPLWMLKVKVI